MPLAKELFFNDGSLNVLGQVILLTGIAIAVLIPIIVGFKRGHASDALIGVFFVSIFIVIIFNMLATLLVFLGIMTIGYIAYSIGKFGRWLSDRFRQ